MATKDINKAIVREQFFKLGKIIDRANEIRAAYTADLASIDKYTADYNEAYIQSQKDKALADLNLKYQELYEDTQKQLDKLQGALEELHGSLEISPALANAVSIIKSIGPDLSTESKRKLNAQFAHDQASLLVLQEAYKSAGAKYNGGLDRQVYSISDQLENLKKRAYDLSRQDISPFRFGVEVGRLATFEGVDFPQGNPFPTLAHVPSDVDLGVFEKTARNGAGLSDKAE
jgi:hypothetical protein